MGQMANKGKSQRGKLVCLRNAMIAIGVIALLYFMFLNDATTWFFSGLNVANATIYMLLVGLLAVAIYRRDQLLKLQKEIVARKEEEIELIHAALNRHALVSVAGPNERITSVNDKFAERLGYSSEELVGKPISMIYPGGESDTVYKQTRKKLEAGEIWSGEHEEVAADGSRIYSRGIFVPMMDDHGQLVRTVGIRTDNTDFHRAQHARSLKALVDHLQDEVYVFDTTSLQMVYANYAALRSSGWEARELTQKTILDADPDRSADPKVNEKIFRAHVAPLFTGEEEVETIDVQRGEGHGEVSTRIIRGDDGRKLFVSVLRDSTKRKEIELAKMQSISIVSHELRTPLTSIKGSLRLLESGALGTFDQKAQSVLDIAARNTDRLLLVIDDILDLEKIRAGKMEFTKSPIDLVTFVAEAVEMNRGYGDELNVNFDFHTDLEAAPTRAAPERIMQVIANLLSNAAKYSPTNGTVHIGLCQDGRFWRIFVSDNGPGIPEEMRDAVFETFSQLKSADGVTRKGTGLGMTISQKIVEAHKGEIGFDSELGKGSTFFVKLPIDEESNEDVGDKPLAEVTCQSNAA